MKVLICTDGSDDAVDAARQGLSLLVAPDAVVVICVVEQPAAATAGFESGFAGAMASPTEIEEAWSEVRAGAASALERTVHALTTQAPIEHLVEVGKAGPVVCRVADDLQADVVIVGSRGRGAVRRALLGSVSNHIVNNAPCAVVVVRAGVEP